MSSDAKFYADHEYVFKSADICERKWWKINFQTFFWRSEKYSHTFRKTAIGFWFSVLFRIEWRSERPEKLITFWETSSGTSKFDAFSVDFPHFSTVLALVSSVLCRAIVLKAAGSRSSGETYARTVEKGGKSSEITQNFDVPEHVSQNVINISARSDRHSMRKNTDNQKPMTVFPNVWEYFSLRPENV